MNKPRVIVYSTGTCPYCTMAKKYLDSKKVSYEEIRVDENPAEAMKMFGKSGQMGVPQIEINGKMIVGFDRNRIDLLLTQKG